MLGAAGVNVTGRAVSKSAALELIRTQKFDFATIDYDLGGETTEEVAILLGEKKIPFVLVSSKINVLKTTPAFKHSPALEKPVSEHILTQTVRRITAR